MPFKILPSQPPYVWGPRDSYRRVGVTDKFQKTPGVSVGEEKKRDWGNAESTKTYESVNQDEFNVFYAFGCKEQSTKLMKVH